MSGEFDENEVVLLIRKHDKEIIPFVLAGLNYSQSSKSNFKKQSGSILVFADGTVREIGEVKRLGLYGKSLLNKFSSLLFGAYLISSKLRIIDVSFVEIKRLILEYLERDMNSYDPSFPANGRNVEYILEKVREADSVDEIFQIIQMPSEEVCLDQL